MKLAVGDAVVYPALGAGRVAAREKRVVLGAEQEVVVLELADGLSGVRVQSLTAPVNPVMPSTDPAQP